MSFQPRFQPVQPQPVWRDRGELREVLRLYQSWYAQGWSDRDISTRIQAKYIKPREGFYAARRAERTTRR